MGAPTFYDKLLLVPPLNLTVQVLDQASGALAERLKWHSSWSPRKSNFAHMAVWVMLFAIILSTGFVGGRHPGSSPEFWREACKEGRRNACQTWITMLNVACQHESGRACMTLGSALNDGQLVPRDLSESAKSFGAACDLSVREGCLSLVALVRGAGKEVLEQPCARGDGESCFFLASLYYAGQGVAKDSRRAVDLFRQSCSSGWLRGCGGLAECYRAGEGVESDAQQAIAYFEKACRGGIAASCFSAGDMYRQTRQEALAEQRFRQACEASSRFTETSAAYFKLGADSQPGRSGKFCP
jgi:TPR repeat protein